MKYLAAFKASLSAVFAFIVSLLGGTDAVLTLLVMLVVTDIITGFSGAFIRKELDSTVMKEGCVHKILIGILIVIAVQLDKVVIETVGGHIIFLDREWEIRTLAIVYFCIEELISVLENVANAGVPIPAWLRASLHKVSDVTNDSTPKFVVEFIKRVFNVDITNLSTAKKPEVKDESSSSVNEPDTNSSLTDENVEVIATSDDNSVELVKKK